MYVETLPRRQTIANSVCTSRRLPRACAAGRASIPARSGRGGRAYQLDRAPKGLPRTQTIGSYVETLLRRQTILYVHLDDFLGRAAALRLFLACSFWDSNRVATARGSRWKHQYREWGLWATPRSGPKRAPTYTNNWQLRRDAPT